VPLLAAGRLFTASCVRYSQLCSRLAGVSQFEPSDRRKQFILRDRTFLQALRLSTQTGFDRGRFWAVVARAVTSLNGVGSGVVLSQLE
jgi:hypothetical protein